MLQLNTLHLTLPFQTYKRTCGGLQLIIIILIIIIIIRIETQGYFTCVYGDKREKKRKYFTQNRIEINVTNGRWSIRRRSMSPLKGI